MRTKCPACQCSLDVTRTSIFNDVYDVKLEKALAHEPVIGVDPACPGGDYTTIHKPKHHSSEEPKPVPDLLSPARKAGGQSVGVDKPEYCDGCKHLNPTFEGYWCRKYSKFITDITKDDSHFIKRRLKDCTAFEKLEVEDKPKPIEKLDMSKYYLKNVNRDSFVKINELVTAYNRMQNAYIWKPENGDVSRG